MITITKGNSFSLIEHLPIKNAKELRTLLSYTDSTSQYYSKFPPKPKYLIDKYGYFPSGLLTKVKEYLNASGLPYALIQDDYAPMHIPFPKLNLGPITPYKRQLESVNAAVSAERGTISMVTGYGKSLTMALLVDALKVRTLIIVPNIELRSQLRASFKVWFGETDLIRIENIDSSALSSCKDYDCLILDEVHHAAAKTYHTLNKATWTGIYHRYGFTATPFRNQPDEHLLLTSIAGDIIYEVDYKQAVKDGAIVPVEAYYIEIPKTATEAYTWAQVYSELVVNHFARNNLIALVMLRLNASGVSTLTLVKEVAHGKKLEALTDLPFASGADNYSRRYIQQFASNEIRSLIGTTGIVGEGVDTKPAEYIIIAGLGKAKSAFMQQVGRTLRKYSGKESAKVIIIKDSSHKFLMRHFKAQQKILLDYYGVAAIKLEL